jgi:hypothetical protein
MLLTNRKVIATLEIRKFATTKRTGGRAEYALIASYRQLLLEQSSRPDLHFFFSPAFVARPFLAVKVVTADAERKPRDK